MNRDRPRDLQNRAIVAALAGMAFSLPAMFMDAVKARMRPTPQYDRINRGGRRYVGSGGGTPKTNEELGCYPKKPKPREWVGKGKTRRLTFVPTCEPEVHVRRDGKWTKYTPGQFANLNPLGLQARGTIIEHVNSFGQVTQRERVRA